MILVIDNFFSNPEVERAKALLSNYSNYEHYPPHFALHDDAEGLKLIEGHVGKKLGYTYPPAYRYYLHEDNQPTYIHSDRDEGQFTTVVFLNQESGPDNGLAFWKHKETGELGAFHIDDLTLTHIEGLDESKWEMVQLVQMKFNRAVIFDSRLYHARYPKDNWATDTGNTRLIKVMFTKEI